MRGGKAKNFEKESGASRRSQSQNPHASKTEACGTRRKSGKRRCRNKDEGSKSKAPHAHLSQGPPGPAADISRQARRSRIRIAMAKHPQESQPPPEHPDEPPAEEEALD